MFKQIIMLTCTVCLLYLTPVRAQETVTLSPKIYSASATMRGLLTSDVPGACALPSTIPEKYANECLSGGTCTCLTFNSVKVGGNLVGSGTGSVSITLDDTDAIPVGGNPDAAQTCTPFHGVAIVATATSKTPSINATIDFQGSLCFSTKNNGTRERLAGGFAISAASDGAYGWGSLSGSNNDATNEIFLSFKGSRAP